MNSESHGKLLFCGRYREVSVGGERLTFPQKFMKIDERNTLWKN
jgi:hypothetical protein